MGINSINPFELPLLNTILLLSSGVTVTYSHHSLIQGNRSGTLYGLLFTIILAILFTGLQGIEYTVSSFTITDGAFGSCFFFFWLLLYRFSWPSLYDRNSFFNRWDMTCFSLSFYRQSSSWTRIRYFIL